MTGQELNAYSQWDTLSRSQNWSADTDFESARRLLNDPPRKGALESHLMREVVDTIGRIEGVADSCVFGVWDGWGWLSSSNELDGSGNDDEFRYILDLEPSLHNPYRSYYLFCGPQGSVLEFGSDLAHRPSPNLTWPTGRSWFLSTEVDFDSTLIGGSLELCEALMAHALLETLPVSPGGSLLLNLRTED